jgi:hypothetical protein
LNLFELFVKIGVDDQASGKLKDLGGKLGNGLKTAAKIGTAAVGAAAAGITALTTAAVNNYAEYEQLVGGVQTLFGLQGQSLEEYADSVGLTTRDALDDWLKYTTGERKILNNAEEAYKSAGLSMNQYMETVTSFSASLIASLGGDTAKAADYADKAIIDMADNANKMGTDISLIQNAYQGFAKQNYTMLDNLKLGYGGTKTEMVRLLQDADALSESFNLVEDENGDLVYSFADIVEAIHIVQDNMGIAGATALEAGTTIEGSVNSMKAAWQNLVTGFADGNADIELLIENLVETIVGDGTKSNLGVIGNVLPAVETALGGIIKLIEGGAPKIVEILPGLVDQIVPSLISAATGIVDAVVGVVPDLLQTVVSALVTNAPALIESATALVESLVKGIQDNYQMLVDGAIGIVNQLTTNIIGLLPEIIALGLDLIVSLANGIAESLPELIPTIMDVIFQIVDTLTNPETLSNLLEAALAIITQLAWGLVDSIPALIDSVFVLIDNIVDFLTDPANLGKLIGAAIELVIAIGVGLVKAIPKLLVNLGALLMSIDDAFNNFDWAELGKNLVDGFKKGIQNAWTNLKKWFKNLFGDLIGIAKKILGIASPSKVFKKLGGFTAEGFGVGFDDEFAHVKDDMENALNFDDASVGINASIRKVGAGAAGGAFGGTSIGNININIDGAKYSDEQSLAAAVALEIQNMTDRRAAVYA